MVSAEIRPADQVVLGPGGQGEGDAEASRGLRGRGDPLDRVGLLVDRMVLAARRVLDRAAGGAGCRRPAGWFPQRRPGRRRSHFPDPRSPAGRSRRRRPRRGRSSGRARRRCRTARPRTRSRRWSSPAPRIRAARGAAPMPASHGFGMMNARSRSCSARNSRPLSAWVVMAAFQNVDGRFSVPSTTSTKFRSSRRINRRRLGHREVLPRVRIRLQSCPVGLVGRQRVEGDQAPRRYCWCPSCGRK